MIKCFLQFSFQFQPAPVQLGRFITGVGVGASSQIVPLYLSEVSPAGLRGTLNGFRRMAGRCRLTSG